MRVVSNYAKYANYAKYTNNLIKSGGGGGAEGSNYINYANYANYTNDLIKKGEGVSYYASYAKDANFANYTYQKFDKSGWCRTTLTMLCAPPPNNKKDKVINHPRSRRWKTLLAVVFFSITLGQNNVVPPPNSRLRRSLV